MSFFPPPRSFRIVLFLGFVLLGLPDGPAIGQEEQESRIAANFDQVGEIVDQWRADQHLWVNGNLGVSPSQLDQLEQWLGENGSNWTIVLMRNARGQSFQRYRGMDAVEHALGKQLANRTDFGQLKDERTGESNGAFFILFLEERKFSYYASDAFDRRSLGENRWVGRLDKPAIAAMRGGGRIIDAVKDTVTSIESQLTRRLESEEAARKRAEIARERAIEEARQLAGEVAAEIERIEEEVAQVRDQHPTASGDLVQLPMASWRGSTKAISDYAAAEEVSEARKLADEVRREMADYRSGLGRWVDDAAELERLEQRLASIEAPVEIPVVEGHLSRAATALTSAQENHALAESLYQEQIEVCDRALDRADSEVLAWKAAVIADQRRQEARQRVIQVAILVAVVLFLIGLTVLNRMRASAKEEAEKTLQDWEHRLKGKFDQLFELMDRATVIVGPSVQLKNRGYDGTTLELCRKTIREVDELFIMSSATDFVIDRARKLVDPRFGWSALMNAFSSRRYREAISQLGSQPIGFDREQGLEAVLEPARAINTETAERSLLGDPGDYEPFRMSFEELIAAYDEKQSTATATVDRLERCIDGLPLLLEELANQLDETTESATELAQAAAGDGFFPMDNLRQGLLPAASANLERAAKRGRVDPVTAMENSASESKRQLASALRLSSLLEKLRSEDFENVRASAGELERLGRKVAWIDDRYGELSNQVEQLSSLLVDRALDEELVEFEDDLLRVRGRVVNCAKLAKRAEKEVTASIDSAASRAAHAREALARQLNLSESSVLVEEALSPFDRIDAARKELDAARIALDRGTVEVAVEDFAEIERLVDEVSDLVELSREVARTHGTRHQKLVKSLEETRGQQPGTTSLLEEMVTRYDSRVLRFSSRRDEKAGRQDSIRDSLGRAVNRLELAEAALENSVVAFREGKLIEAGGRLERAGNEIGFARHQLSLIEDQHAALKAAEEKNVGDLAELRRRYLHLAESVADRRTMRPTMEQHEAAGAALDQIESDLGRKRPDPFAALVALDEQRGELNAVEQGVDSDRTRFANATATVEQARQHLSQSDQVVHVARTDQIPDSPRLESGMRRHQQLADHLVKMEAVLNRDHADWPSVEEATLATIEEIIKARSLMEAELAVADKASKELHRASSTISELQGWRSRHRTRFDRQAGWGTFVNARDALARGDYQDAFQQATEARRKASWELSSARREERQAEAAAEAARRRRQAAMFSSSSNSHSSFGSSGISFGGGGSSFSSGSSGFSSGSFSSGSGVSRSGW